MTYTTIGRTGLKVSRLCLGTMNFGPSTDEAESFRIMDATLAAGINFFDTANNYGFQTGSWGQTESILGRWFAQGGGRRRKVVLATKVHEAMHDVDDGPNGDPGLSLYKIRRHLKASLERLQTDHLELYYLHHVDRRVGWDEVWGALEGIVLSGQVDYIGSSNFAGWDLAVAQGQARSRNFLGLTVEQHLYNLACRTAELEVLPSAQAHGLGFVPWSPLAGGRLARLRADRTRSGSSTAPGTAAEAQDLQYRTLCRDLGEAEDTVALAWLLSRAGVTAPVIGPRTVRQFEDTLRATEITLSSETLTRLEEIFPGPGGSAPEAYAW